MINTVSVDTMRSSDAWTIEHLIPSKELMYRAGLGIYKSASWKAPVAIVCGSGNNAGDGYVLAKLLIDKKIPCTVILLEEKFSPDGRYYFESLGTEAVVYFGKKEPLGTDPLEKRSLVHFEDREDPSERVLAVPFREGRDLQKYSTIVD